MIWKQMHRINQALNPVVAKQIFYLTSYTFHDIKLGNQIMKFASICLFCRNVLLLGRIFTAFGKPDKLDRRMDDKAVDDISLLANGQKY
jgi:hypothetical protein